MKHYTQIGKDTCSKCAGQHTNTKGIYLYNQDKGHEKEFHHFFFIVLLWTFHFLPVWWSFDWSVTYLPIHVFFISQCIAFLLSTYLEVELLDTHAFTSSKECQRIVQMVEPIYSFTQKARCFAFVPTLCIILFSF